LGILIVVGKKWQKVKATIFDTKTLLLLLLSGTLLATNWLIFIWSVNNDHLLDASLGYYINPLINVLLAYVLLGERFRRLQLVAIFLALTGVSIMVISHGTLPWVAIVLAFSFGFYGLIRKKLGVESVPGLAIETALMTPVALIYWVGFATTSADMLSLPPNTALWLFLTGAITTAPLLCFTAAASRLKYSTIGFFQYIGPSIMFFLAVFLYDEPLDYARLLTFVGVWGGSLLFVYDAYRYHKK
jgi:chloramphenicol-sensitive protein RarD